MTTEEFSNEFDIQINAFSASEAFGTQQNPLKFDEYEKSLFLTEAQELIVKNLYNGKLTGDGFEKTEELRRSLSDLVKTKTLDPTVGRGLNKNSYFFQLPPDVWFITYEAATSNDDNLKCMKGTTLEVVPVTQDEFHKTIMNPFRKPNKRRALRLDVEGNIVEIVSDYTISEYLIRYLSRPNPIILTNLPGGLTINEESKITQCELHPALHRTILESAVKLAIASRTSAGKSNV